MTAGEISLLIGLVVNAIAVFYAAWLNSQKFNVAIAGLEAIKKQTDGVIAQVTALAKDTGHLEGTKEATQKAENTAATLALGQQQGRDAERESIASKTLVTKGDQPLPVADDRTATAGERVADATERSASAAQRVADVAEDKKK